MKKILYFLLIALFCGAFASCSKDDNGDDNGGGNNSSYEELIVGTWKLVKEAYGGPVEEVEDDYKIVFKGNGTCYWIEDGYRDDEAEWEIDGNYIYIYYGYYEEEMKIKKLTQKELVITDEDGYTAYYDRVN